MIPLEQTMHVYYKMQDPRGWYIDDLTNPSILGSRFWYQNELKTNTIGKLLDSCRM